ncbi:MAG TPA: diguanylate cyclase [Motiliproteus sp.]
MKDDAASSSLTPTASALEAAIKHAFSSRYLLVEGIEECPVPLFVIDKDHRITLWNKALVQLTGLSPAEMLGTRNHWQAFYPHERPTMADLTVDGTVEENIERLYHGKYQPSPMLEGGYEVSDFFPGIGDNGCWIYFMAAPLKDASGCVIGAIETLQDVTSRNRAEALVKENQSYLRQIVDGSSVPTFVIDREHRVTHWNRACEALTGFSADELVGTRDQWRPFYESERPVMADLILDSAIAKDVDRFYHGKFSASQLIDGAFEAEDFFPHFGERGLWLFFTAAPLNDAQGNFIGAIETLQDITAQKQAEISLRASEEQLKVMCITDALTSLFNARHFHQQVKIEIKRAVRHQRPLSLLMIDLDDFKKLNDEHGHLEGDKALATAANVIKHSFRELDTAFRYGGEEFVVLLPDTPREPAHMLAELLLKNLANTVLMTDAGQELRITASIGVSEYITPETSSSFVRRADEGVYRAKRLGKNRVEACEPGAVSGSTGSPPQPHEHSRAEERRGELASDKPTLLIVDDSPDDTDLMCALLKDLYMLQVVSGGEAALKLAQGYPQPDLVLLAASLPGLSGYEVCQQLKGDPRTRDIAVILLTATGDEGEEQLGLDLVGVDYIAKPVTSVTLLARVKTQLSLKRSNDLLKNMKGYLDGEVAKRTREAMATQDVTILAMLSLAEARNNETGNHIRRTQHYVKTLAERLQHHPRFSDFLSDEIINLLFNSAPLHDIGKVGIPDRILLKPQALEPDEFEIIKTHAWLGREAIQHAEEQLGTQLALLEHAKDIACHHHEQWDGSGYPGGLAGDDIPIAGRLMAVADVYDALISRRVYKDALPHETAVEIIVQGRGTQFDPDIVDAFIEVTDQFKLIATSFPDHHN